MANEKLKECPFCGSTDVVLNTQEEWDTMSMMTSSSAIPQITSYMGYVFCESCGAVGAVCRENDLDATGNAATKKWNNRYNQGDSSTLTDMERSLYRRIVRMATKIGYYEGILGGVLLYKNDLPENIVEAVEEALRRYKEKE